MLLKDFAKTSQNAYWQKYTFESHFPEIYGYYSWDCNNFPWQKVSWCYKQINWEGHVALLLKPIFYEVRAIHIYLEGPAFSVSTIC